MRRGLALALVCLPVAACGLVSGLDNLGIDGGIDGAEGVDASDATADVGDVTSVDAGSDGGIDVEAGSTTCSYDSGNPHCFGVTCGMSNCCVREAGTLCDLGCSNGVLLACTDPDSCPSDAGNCCLQNVSFDASASCPYTLGSSVTGTSSFCTSDNCEAAGRTRICTGNADCPMGLHCRAATLSTNPAVSLGVCLF